MFVQDGSLNTPRTIWPTLNRIQLSLGFSYAQMADFCHLTLKRFLSLKAANKDLPLENAFFLCDHFNIGIEKLVTGNIDFIALVQQFTGNSGYVPERYLESANSKRRTVINILNYIENDFGWESKFRYLQRFQMSESMFLDADAPINLRYSVDLCNTLLKEARNPEVLLKIGRNSVKTHKNSEMGKTLSKARNLSELFEMMFPEVLEKYIEKNIRWKIISMGNNKCVLEGSPDHDIVGVLGKENVFASSGSYVREGFVSSIPGYLGYNHAPIKRLSCVSQGDTTTRFALDFNPIIRSKKTLLSAVS